MHTVSRAHGWKQILVHSLVSFPSISDLCLPYAPVLANGTSFSTFIPLILIINIFGQRVPWINNLFLHQFGWNRAKISIFIPSSIQGDDNLSLMYLTSWEKVSQSMESQVMWSSHSSLWNLWPWDLQQQPDRDVCHVYVTSWIFPSLPWYQMSLNHLKQSLLEMFGMDWRTGVPGYSWSLWRNHFKIILLSNIWCRLQEMTEPHKLVTNSP